MVVLNIHSEGSDYLIFRKTDEAISQNRHYFFDTFFSKVRLFLEQEREIYFYANELKKRIVSGEFSGRDFDLKRIVIVYQRIQKKIEDFNLKNPLFSVARSSFYDNLQDDIFNFLNRESIYLMQPQDLVSCYFFTTPEFKNFFYNYPKLEFSFVLGRSIYSCCDLGLDKKGNFLGRGDFGRIFSCFEWTFRKPLAVKITVATDRLKYRRLISEGNLLMCVKDCFYVIGAKSIGYLRDYQMLFIVMEYFEGRLWSHLKLPLLDELWVLHHVSMGLKELFKLQIVHRNITKETVMVKKQINLASSSVSFQAKIVDLSYACKAFEDYPGFIGDPSCMSPESLLCQKLDCKSDVYSFGLLFYQVFFKRELCPLIQDGKVNLKNYRFRKTRDLIPDMRDLRYKDVPLSIENRIKIIVQSCLKRNPKERVHPFQLCRLIQKLQDEILCLGESS